jgi:uncharacterized Zn-binding protein involved in type VI secretion
LGAPAVVLGDAVTGQCPNHLMPGPLGVPQPAPPLPFNAPLTQGLATTVTVAGKPVAVAGAAGLDQPPHAGLHPADPFLVPVTQRGTAAGGSATVLIGGKPAVRTGDPATCCVVPGTLAGSASTVLIGG